MFRQFISPPRGVPDEQLPWLVDVRVPGSKEDVWYRVRQHVSGRWTCTCKGFSYRQQDCKHIKLVQDVRTWSEEKIEALV